ncbi:uridine kinase family protein [Microcella sp.]|uniref:uridine kinase family protein n=1 Tax=Microcella sp. TaxID=1913979 RepID=UPI00256648A7|nr:zeta toxin family protein [Microcella sp.]MBX9472111.1 zeta toxin family protein [Microcella sp.]
MSPRTVGIDEVVTQITALRDARTPVIVGIDGAGGSGKSTLAAAIAERLGADAVVIPMDDFIVRERMLDDSWDRGWDHDRLLQQVITPLRRGEPVVYQRREWSSNSLSDPIAVPGASIVIVEGITALHPTLAPHWDLAIWVETDAMIALERGRARDAGNENAQHWELWSSNDARYRAEHEPHGRADLIVRGA